jgi:hypothetical protein
MSDFGTILAPSQGSTGQMQIVAAAQPIPFPSNVGIAPDSNPGPIASTALDGALRKIRATDDIYYGYSSAVTVATGYYVPAGTEETIDARAKVWFVGIAKTGESSSSSLSNVPQFSSSSSGASQYPTSSSSGVPVATYGTLFWVEASN